MKKLLKVFLLTALMTMLFSATALAATTSTPVQKAKSLTLYAVTDTGTQQTLELKENTDKGVKYEMINVSSSNRDIVGVTESGDSYIFTAKKNGKAVISYTLVSTRTIKNKPVVKNSKKKITITVKSMISTIDAADVTIAASNGSKVAVNASVNASASSKKLGYAITDDKGVAKKTNEISINSKGTITANSRTKADTDYYVTITAKDIKNSKCEAKTIKVSAKAVDVEKAEISIADKENVSKGIVYLKTNTRSQYHTYNTAFQAVKGSDVANDKVTFVSSKPSVATVDNEGKVTAVGNGSAVISIVSKKGNAIKGISNKSKLKYTVKVLTDVETISVADTTEGYVGSKITLKPVVNAGANKKLTYTVKEGGSYITVSSSGVVSLKKYPTTDTKISVAIASAEKNTTNNKKAINKARTQIVDIKINNAISKIEFKDTDKVKRTFTKVNGDYEAEEVTSLDEICANLKITDKAKAEMLNASGWATVTSSKPSVALIVGNKLYAMSAGTTKITIKALGGSKASLSYNLVVKQRITDINVTTPDGVVTQDTDFYIEAGKDAKITLKAATNKSATVKKLAFEYKKVAGNDSSFTYDNKKNVLTVTSPVAGDKAIVTIKANDDSNNTKAVVLTYEVVSADKVASEDAYSLAVDERIIVEKGSSKDISAVLTTVDSKIATSKAVAWTTANKKIATVTATSDSSALIKAVALGETEITVKHTFSGKTATIKVWVVEPENDIRKDINKKISERIKAEDRSWTGIKLSFDSSYNTFNAAIVDPYKQVNEVDGTGISALLTDVYDREFVSGTILYFVRGERYSWQLTKVAAGFTAQKDSEEPINCATMDDFVELVKHQPEFEDVCWADMDMNETSIYILGKKIETSEKNKFTREIEFCYTIGFNMSQAVYEQINDDYNMELTMSYGDSVVHEAGIENIVYDASTNEFTLFIGNPKTLIQEGAFNYFINDFASKALFRFDSAEIKAYKTTTKRYYYSIDDPDSVDTIYKSLCADLNAVGITELGVLQTAGADVYATEGKYTNNFSIRFDRSEKSVDDEKDGLVNDKMSDVITSGEYLKTKNFDVATNTLTFGLNGNKYDDGFVLNLKDLGILEVAEGLIDANKNTVKSVTVNSVAGKSSTFESSDEQEIIAKDCLKAIYKGVSESAKFDELVSGQDAEIIISYSSGDKTYDIKYIVKFEWAEGYAKPAPADTTSLSEEDVEESVVEEPSAEEPVVEEPSTEEPVVEEPSTEEPVVEEPSTEEPVVEEPSTEVDEVEE